MSVIEQSLIKSKINLVADFINAHPELNCTAIDIFVYGEVTESCNSIDDINLDRIKKFCELNNKDSNKEVRMDKMTKAYILPCGKFNLVKSNKTRHFNFDDDNDPYIKNDHFYIFVSNYGYPQIILSACKFKNLEEDDEVTFYHDQNQRAMFNGKLLGVIPVTDHSKVGDFIRSKGLGDKIGGNKVCFYVFK